MGCGIGDTELLLAPYVGSITGVDLSPSAIKQAGEDARSANVSNVQFIETGAAEAAFEEAGFDAVIGIFFLHHLPGPELRKMADRIRRWLRPGGVFYGLDPSYYRLSGALGSILIPRMMRRYQTPDEHELKPREAAACFREAGFEARFRYFDFCSTPFSGLFPAWRFGYQSMRALDQVLIRVPLLRLLSSNFELIAKRP